MTRHAALVACLLLIQFKVLVIVFKVLHVMGPDSVSFQWDWSTQLPMAEGACADQTVKEFQLAGSRRTAFTFMASYLWNILLLEVRSIPTFLAFWKGLKTWLCQLAWGCEGALYPGGGWWNLREISHLCTLSVPGS